MSSVAVHSYKGGTGKTVITANLAYLLAKRGYKVCAVDCDFRAPSLGRILGAKGGGPYFNDVLSGEGSVLDAVRNVEGSLYVIPADSSGEAIKRTLEVEMDKEWQARALRILVSSREYLKGEFDYVFFDTSPGFSMASINAIAVSDHALLVTRFDDLDVSGTRELLNSVYSLLEKKPSVIVNKVPPGSYEEEVLRTVSESLGLKVVSVIPCFCEVLKASGKIIAREDPDHPFVRHLEKIVGVIEEWASR